MLLFRSIALLAGAAVTAVAQSPAVERDGLFWARNGQMQPFELPAHVKRLDLYTRGSHVTVRGTDSNQVRVKVEQRVRAASAEDAARYWGGFRESLNPFEVRGDRMQMRIEPPGASRVETGIKIEVPRRLAQARVENRGGGVDIVDLDGNVQVATDGGPLSADRIRGNLIANTGMGAIRLGSIGGWVRCSSQGGEITLQRSGGEASCYTGGGDVVVDESGGELNLSTEGGNVRVGNAARGVRARSMAGVIDVQRAGGAVFADTGGGAIQVAASKGLQAEAASGMVLVRGSSGPLSVSTIMGNILAELFQGAPLENSTFAAQSGDITVFIPAGLGITVRARNESRLSPRILSDFPEVRTRSLGFLTPVTGEGAIQGGGPLLDLSAAGGVIYLKRMK